MNEQLLKIERILLESPSGYVFLAGLALFIMGLFLWIGGLKYLKLVSGMLGGATGAIFGSILAATFNMHTAGTVAISAAIFAIGAVLLQQLIILLVATIIFGLIFGGGYMEYAIGKGPAPTSSTQTETMHYDNQQGYQQSDNSSFQADNPFGHMQQFGQTAENLNRAGHIAAETGKYAGTFFEKIKAVFSELTPTMSNNAGYLILWCVLGAIIGLVLAQLLKTIVMALCCSIVGATGVVAGVIISIIAKGTDAWTILQGHGRVMTMVFLSMVIFGWLFQILTRRSTKKTPQGDNKVKE